MKKILKALVTYFLVIAAVFLIFALFNRDEGFFTTYNIMSGLAYGGLLVFVIFGFVSKKGNHAMTVAPMHLPANRSHGLPLNPRSIFSVLVFESAAKDVIEAMKKPVPTHSKKEYITEKEDPLAVRIILFVLPFVVGIGSMAVGIMWLINW
ncbi:MAG: hypothetical protein E7432_01790 [Ruminococcaceae bacterium]|nr:hypothetical protein [Oscillospiraceae bacterium]